MVMSRPSVRLGNAVQAADSPDVVTSMSFPRSPRAPRVTTLHLVSGLSSTPYMSCLALSVHYPAQPVEDGETGRLEPPHQVSRRGPTFRFHRGFRRFWDPGDNPLHPLPQHVDDKRVIRGAQMWLRRVAAQHSTTFTARPPTDVSLYFAFMSAPVCRMVSIATSSDTWCRPSP